MGYKLTEMYTYNVYRASQILPIELLSKNVINIFNISNKIYPESHSCIEIMTDTPLQHAYRL